jgi:hypothetical protein
MINACNAGVSNEVKVSLLDFSRYTVRVYCLNLLVTSMGFENFLKNLSRRQVMPHGLRTGISCSWKQELWVKAYWANRTWLCFSLTSLRLDKWTLSGPTKNGSNEFLLFRKILIFQNITLGPDLAWSMAFISVFLLVKTAEVPPKNDRNSESKRNRYPY